MSESSVQPLTRVLGPLGVALLTLSVLSPGASVLVAGADILHHAGTGAPLAFLLGGLMTLVFTFAQAELGSSFPLAGGDYATVGNTLGPLAGFMQFGLGMLGVPVFMAVSAAGVSLYLRTIWPGLPVNGTALAALMPPPAPEGVVDEGEAKPPSTISCHRASSSARSASAFLLFSVRQASLMSRSSSRRSRSPWKSCHVQPNVDVASQRRRYSS